MLRRETWDTPATGKMAYRCPARLTRRKSCGESQVAIPVLLTARENPGILRSTARPTAIIKRDSQDSQDSQDPGKTEDSGCTSIRMSHESTCGEAGCISAVLTMRDSCSLTVVKPGKVVVTGAGSQRITSVETKGWVISSHRGWPSQGEIGICNMGRPVAERRMTIAAMGVMASRLPYISPRFSPLSLFEAVKRFRRRRREGSPGRRNATLDATPAISHWDAVKQTGFFDKLIKQPPFPD